MAKFPFNNNDKYFRVIKYILAGGTATVVNLILLYFLTEFFQLWYLISSAIAFIISFFVSFYLQKFWTFQDENKKKIYQQIRLYGIVALANLGLNTGLMYFSVDILKIWYLLAQILTSGLIAIESFLIYNFLIFNQQIHSVSSARQNQKENLKILIVTGSFPPNLGGPAALLANLIPELIEQGYQVTVLTYGDRRDQLPYEVVRISMAHNKLSVILRLFYTAVKLARLNHQIYTFDVYSTGFSAWLASKLTGRRLVARFTGDSAWETAFNRGWTKDNIVEFQRKFINLKISFIKWCRNTILKACAVIITDCYFLKNLLISFGIEESKIMVVHNSVEYLPRPKQFNREQFRRERQLKEKVILTICRLVPWKGVGTLISLLPDLKRDFPNISFVNIGDGPQLASLKAEGERMKKEQGIDIRFLGNLPRREIIPWYLIADVYVLNTNYEGIAHTLVEALYFRVPVVTTAAGGNPEIIVNQYNGLVVEYDNRQQLLQAIKRVFSDNDLVRLFKDNGVEKLKGDFLWEKVVATNLKALRKV